MDPQEAQERKEYLAQHPEIRELLVSYVEALLLNKPTDIDSFTLDFFEPYLEDATEGPTPPEDVKASVDEQLVNHPNETTEDVGN